MNSFYSQPVKKIQIFVSKLYITERDLRTF